MPAVNGVAAAHGPGAHVVACPRPFVPAEQHALAIAECGALGAYVTGFVWPRFLPAAAVAAAVRALTGKVIGPSLAHRQVATLSPPLVRSLLTVDLARSLASAVKARFLADRLWEVDDRRFARAVARRYGPGCRVVHGFEHSSLEFFREARRRGKPAVLHLASVHPYFQDRVLDAQYARYPHLCRTADWELRQRRQRRDARRVAEFEAADFIITYSAFASRTLTGNGVPSERVVAVPLGAPVVPLAEEPPPPPPDRPLVVLFAGLVGVRKGCHLLLEAWARVRRPGWRLVLAGRNDLPAGYAEQDGVEVLGPVGQRQLFALMQTSDVLAFPTLIDSFGMVVTEALGHGLPVITTTNAGAADLIRDGVNGWVLPAGDVAALADRLEWCGKYLDQLRALRPQARASAKTRTWTEYRQDLRNCLTTRGLLASQ